MASGRQRHDDSCAYGECDGSGLLLDFERNEARPCRCRPARQARRRAARLNKAIPAKYQGASFDRPPLSDLARTSPDVARRVKAYARDITTMLERGYGLALVGDPGRGKTT